VGARRIAIVGFYLGVVLALSVTAVAPAWGASEDAFSWGRDSYGALGDGGSEGSDRPVQVSGLSEVAALAGGEYHSLALLTEGTVMAWGANGHGQLGDGNTTASPVPVAVSGLSGVTAIAAGESHSLALLSGGSVEAWGGNEFGELGDGSTEDSDVPVAVSGLSEATAIAAGSIFNLALMSGGSVEAWGGNENGQLGDGGTEKSETPVAVSGLSGVTAVAASGNHALALLSDGTVEAWGGNEDGQLGDGGTEKSDVPVAVSGLGGVTAIAAGARTSYALLGDGTVMAWGENKWGELGDGTTVQSDVPVAVHELSGVTAVAGGGNHAFALLGSGTVEAWGGDEYGELGNGSMGTGLRYELPVAVACGLEGIVGISSDYWGGLAWGAPAEVCPTVRSVSPHEGSPSGETEVTITGSAFTGATAVKFGSTEATSFTVESPTVIKAVAPAGKETVNITVTTPKGTSAIGEGDLYTYSAPPTVTGLSTDTGPAAGDTYVVIHGTNLGNVTAVKFGATNAKSFFVEEGSYIEAYSPPGTGTVDVAVTNPSGTSEATAADRFTYLQAPEYGRCIKLGNGRGEYSTSSCEYLGEEKIAYEWYPAFGVGRPLEKRKFTADSSLELKLETTGKTLISCKAESGSGEYTGAKAVSLGALTLTGCHDGTHGSCQSEGAKEGEVQTNPLAGQLGTISKAKAKYGLQLGPASGEALAEFSCAGVPVTLRGSVILEDLKADKMLSAQSLKATQKKGAQKTTHFEGGPQATLQAKIGAAAAYEQAGLTGAITQTSEESVEINTAV